jgi:hypothetical protein
MAVEDGRQEVGDTPGKTCMLCSIIPIGVGFDLGEKDDRENQKGERGKN